MILSVNSKDFSYDIVVEKGCLLNAKDYLNLNRKVLIITDSGVPTRYSEIILKCFTNRREIAIIQSRFNFSKGAKR